MNKHLASFSLFLLSFIIIAFGQPAWSSFLPYFAAFIGYALFWHVMLQFPSKKNRFLLAFFWFAAVQGIQLSWMTSIDYQGPMILPVYAFLCLALGVQFGFLSLGIPPGEKKISITRCFALSGCWVILEWSRLFFLSGFSWNPVGLSLTQDSLSSQLAAFLGIYGLSFWVILVNLLLVKIFRDRSKLSVAVCLSFAIFPFGYGYLYRQVHSLDSQETLSVALVQTGLFPEEKEYLWRANKPMPPLEQWKRIFQFLQEKNKNLDLIVLPEVVVPYGTNKMIYSKNDAISMWKSVWRETQSLPVDEQFQTSDRQFVCNAFFAQALANYFHADLIAGFYDFDSDLQKYYNAAHFFTPKGNTVLRYEKQVLVPVGEYFPFQWCQEVAKNFGIYLSFEKGQNPKIFPSKMPIAVSICYEETYSHIVNQMRKIGAEFFVNITNDMWFPNSKLPEQHFSHGKVRAIENGVSLVRACNSGVTAGVNCFGDTVGRFGAANDFERESGALFLQVPKTSIQTFYSKAGDFTILTSSVFFIGLYFTLRRKS